MGKQLTRRYTAEDFKRLSELIRPYEQWTSAERKAWVADDCYGFRQFIAANVTPIEHFWPQSSPAIHTPKTKPAA
jgi:hypothetical protein